MKIKARCPHCVHDFEVEVPEPKKSGIPSLEVFNTLKDENDRLRWENQRLSIINHQHRGE